MPEVDANGATLAYEVHGEGEPLVLIAGCGQPEGAWVISLVPPLFYATETLRYLPQHELQDSEVVATWLALIGDLPPWPNPGRLGQYEAALSWSTDSVRTTRWPEVRVPCLVLAFEHDIDSPPHYARQAADRIPGCAYREVAGAGHLGIVTHAEIVSEILIQFFAGA